MTGDQITAAVAAELAPSPGGGPISDEVRARVEELLPQGVAEFDELYESNGVRLLQGPWPYDIAALLVARGICRGAEVGVEYGEVVIRHKTGSVSTLTPAEEPFVRPWADPDGCRHCGVPRPHGQQSVDGGPLHGYVAPYDWQRLARMQERRKKRTEGSARERAK